jgi:23S rRNA pseudouridine2605 synthase
MSRRVHLNRLLSKLGVLSRSQAVAAILDGRVSVNGRVVRDPGTPVDPLSARVVVDGRRATGSSWQTLAFHKPRGVVTTRRDPEGRPTIFDVLGAAGRGLAPVGRLDMATSGLLLLTSDTALLDWLTDPRHAVPRTYTVSVRGRVTPEACARLAEGVRDRGEWLKAGEIVLRKASGRESHLIVTLHEGKNREIRRLFKTAGHEVTRLARVAFGGVALGALAPGGWRHLSEAEVRSAFPALAAERPHGPLSSAPRGMIGGWSC